MSPGFDRCIIRFAYELNSTSRYRSILSSITRTEMACLIPKVTLLLVIMRLSNVVQTSQVPIKIIQPSIFPNVSPFIKFSNHNDSPVVLPEELKRQLIWGSSVPLVNTIIRKTGLTLINLKNQRENKQGVSSSAPLWMGAFKTTISRAWSPAKMITREYQKYNLIPGGEELCHKDKMWFNFQKYLKKFGSAEFPFLIESYAFPGELFQFLRRLQQQRYCDGNDRETPWIFKSSSASNSKGMFAFYNWKINRMRRKGIIQTFLAAWNTSASTSAYTINGHSMRYRAYILVTSFHPLRIYLYNEGEIIVGKTYAWDTTSHYIEHKDLMEFLATGGHDVEHLKKKIEDVVIKSMFVVEHKISRHYATKKILKNHYNAYQFWSADIIFDINLEPKLMEINRYADLNLRTASSENLRPPLVTETLDVAGYHFPSTLSTEAKKFLLDQLTLLNTTGNNDLDSIVFQRQLYSLQENKLSSKAVYVSSLYYNGLGYTTREIYSDKILENLEVEDVKTLMRAEDELSRTRNYKRIFPTNTTYKYLRYLQSNPYNYMLQDAWESKYGQRRGEGIKLLTGLAARKLHLMG